MKSDPVPPQLDGAGGAAGRSQPWTRWSLQIALYFVVIAGLTYAVHRAGGLARLLEPWQLVPLPALILAAGGQLGAYALRALRIYKAEAAIPRDQFLRCLRLIALNNAANWLLPMRSGEASFPLLMRRWFGVELTQATGVLMWLRLLDLHVLATVGALSLWSGVLTQLPTGPLRSASSVVLVGAVGAMLAPLLLYALKAPVQSWAARGPGRLRRIGHKLFDGVPQRPGFLAADLLLCWAAWSVKLAALGLLLATLAGLSNSLGLLGAIGGDLSTVLPLHTPGGFGTYEAGVVAALSTSGHPLPDLLHAAVNLHLFVLGLAVLAGALALIERRPPSPTPPRATEPGPANAADRSESSANC